MIPRRVVALVVCCATVVGPANAGHLLTAPATQDPGVEPDVLAVLTTQLRFSAGELADMRRGKIVKHGLPATGPGEVAVVGGVRVHAAKAAFLARVRDIVRFKSGPDVLQIGRFSNPPVLEDLAALTVDTDDFDVRSCRVGDCGIRLPADAIARFAREIDVKAPDAQERGAALFKQILFDHVAAYSSGSVTGRMTQFDDGPKPIRPEEEFNGILASMPEIGALVPGLPDHLRHVSNRLPDATDLLYWSKEKFGIAPFITVTQVTIVCPSAATCVMATRDVYSSRYLDASIALSIAADAGGTLAAFDLVYGNRSRANALKGGWAGLRRSLTERRARGGLEESLNVIKMQLEKG